MRTICIALSLALVLGLLAPVCFAQQDENKSILKEGLMGAATGAIASSASGGKAGKGALIGAGVNVVGGALLDTITAPAPQPTQQVQAVQAVPVQQVSGVPSLFDQGYQRGFQDGYDKGYAAGIAAKR